MPQQYWNSPYNAWQQGPPPPWASFPQRPYSPRPTQHEANMADANYMQPRDFQEAFNTMTLTEQSPNWYMDFGATSHLDSSSGNLHSVTKLNIGNSVVVGNGSSIPINSSGKAFLSSNTRTLNLNNVLITPDIVKNLISVRRFTKDNWCSIEFDPFGFSVKDLQSRKTILRSDSSGDLYSVLASLKPQQHTALVTKSPTLWHKRLAHANPDSLKSIMSSSDFSCNKDSLQFCNACQLGKHLNFPFSKSNNTTLMPFEIVHSDLWTSPIQSLSGYKYYVMFLDDFTHHLWVYPLRRKGEVFSKFIHFSAVVQTQFGVTIKSLQCDNGGEYNNGQFLKHFSDNGISFRFSCPHTSQQNGKSERMIWTINNAIRALLF